MLLTFRAMLPRWVLGWAGVAAAFLGRANSRRPTVVADLIGPSSGDGGKASLVGGVNLLVDGTGPVLSELRQPRFTAAGRVAVTKQMQAPVVAGSRNRQESQHASSFVAMREQLSEHPVTTSPPTVELPQQPTSQAAFPSTNSIAELGWDEMAVNWVAEETKAVGYKPPTDYELSKAVERWLYEEAIIRVRRLSAEGKG
eukprot:TRINITY_DN26636_c0_g1_i1.p1 TRINITY_DN26636_c0_g1~~TRINITY_DN26636_c0_g1_i1.p1  ORF type:complete len:199 (+),score=36.07 TRINITY_DN26636_c0_g1_i1:115-711(+)